MNSALSLAQQAFHEVGHGRRGGFDMWLGYENNNSQYDCWLHGHTEDGTEVRLRTDLAYCGLFWSILGCRRTDFGLISTQVPPTRLPGYETDVLT